MAVVEQERRGHVEILRFNRPEARNAISPEVSKTMSALLDAAADDPDVRAVVVTGTGPVFSAGADLKVIAQGGAGDIASAPGGFAGMVTRDFPKPLIAAVNGPALAGGFEIVLSCDLVVASDTARFGVPEVQRGLMAAAGALIRLPKRVPMAIALELTMTGDPISAERALELGLVNRVVPADQVLEVAVALAERIGENSPVAVRVSRRLVREAIELTEAEAWKRNDERSMEVFRGGDMIEGATAFAEKRAPVWKST
jgi:enoyl-CoA hydratase/carnithine racemase